VELISLKDGLLDEMMAVGCITRQQRDAVRELNLSSADRNRKLLDILSRRSVAHFDLFLTCLRRNAQGHVANFLADGGGKRRRLTVNFVKKQGVALTKRNTTGPPCSVTVEL